MKIGILSPSVYMYQRDFAKRIYAPGRLAMALANGLVAAGQDVLFFTAPDTPTSAAIVSADAELLSEKRVIEPQQDLSEEAMDIVSLYETKKYYEMGLTAKAYHYAQDKKVDVIHNFNSLSNLSHYFVEMISVPTVYTLHRLPSKEGTLERWRYERFLRQNFIAISDFQKRAFEETIPGINIVDTIYHGIEAADFSFTPEKQEDFIFMGRVSPEKGLDQALLIAKQAGINLKVTTVIDAIIKASAYYKEKIAHLLENATVHGYKDGEEKNTFLKNAKALLFPVMDDEPFGMIMIETMACGTPVIAYNRGSVSEIVRDGVTGFVIDPPDADEHSENSNFIIKKKGIEGMVEAIRRIDEIDRSACRRHVEENFSLKKMVASHEALYKKILQGM